VTRALERLVARLLVIVAVGFIGIPIIAIFLRVSLASMLDGLTSEAAREALALSFKTTLISLGVILIVGTPVAYVLVTRPIRGRDAITTLLELPLVMPPAVAGIALLSAFGARGAIGGPLGLELPFTTAAVILAQIFVASPFYLRQAQAAFEAIAGETLEAARACGASPTRTLVRIAAPLAAGGLLTGAVLAWARALGEFGATLIFAGSFQGVTQTAPLAIYGELDNDIPAALGLSAVLVLISFAVLISVKIGARRWTLPS
jgi:molybdate transport system permease protein